MWPINGQKRSPQLAFESTCVKGRDRYEISELQNFGIVERIALSQHQLAELVNARLGAKRSGSCRQSMARINPKTSRSEVTEAATMHHNAKWQAMPVKATTGKDWGSAIKGLSQITNSLTSQGLQDWTSWTNRHYPKPTT